MTDSILQRPVKPEANPAKLTLADFQQNTEYAAKTADTNHDGVATLRELQLMERSAQVDPKLLPSVEFMIDHYDALQYRSSPAKDGTRGVSPELVHELSQYAGGADVRIDTGHHHDGLNVVLSYGTTAAMVGGTWIGAAWGVSAAVGVAMLPFAAGLGAGLYVSRQDNKKVGSVLRDIRGAEDRAANWP